MRTGQNSDDSDHQGFQQTKIRVMQTQSHHENKINLSNINLLFGSERPKDFLPRSMYLDIGLKQNSKYLQESIIKGEIIKQIDLKIPQSKSNKHRSFQDKYQSGNQYKLIYKKHNSTQNEDFMCSYLSLKDIMDYNPKNYKTFRQNCNQNKQSYFNSNFESGNLLYAFQLSHKNQYQLIIQNDTNTKGYNQWFFFSFKNKDLIQKSVHFNIVNFVKKITLFTYNVKPLIFSMKAKQNQGIGWTPLQKDINYYKNSFKRQNQRNYYTLNFTYQFKYDDDEIFFAMNLPYTYSKLISFLNFFQKEAIMNFTKNSSVTHKSQQIFIERKILCYTISNNAIPYITMGSKNPKFQVVIMARQHPGETVSSYLVQKVMLNLLSNKRLLQIIQFIIIPMLNPDGVIYGNFRTNLGGFDLNRQWLQPDKILHPQVFYAKKLILSQPSIKMILDLHGHSKKFNSFIYANKLQDQIQQKIFCCLMSKSEFFSLKDCQYGLSTDKLKTARGTLKKQNIDNIFTFQTSFFGYLLANNNYMRFGNFQYSKLAKNIVDSIQIYLLYPNSDDIQGWKLYIKHNIFKFDEWQRQKKSDDASDSNPSEDQLDQSQRTQRVLCIQQLDRKRKIKKTIQTKISFPENKELQKNKQIEFARSDIKKLESKFFSPRKFLYNKTQKPETVKSNREEKQTSSKILNLSYLKPPTSTLSYRKITNVPKQKSEKQAESHKLLVQYNEPISTILNLTRQSSRFLQNRKKGFKKFINKQMISLHAQNIIKPNLQKIDLSMGLYLHSPSKLQLKNDLVSQITPPTRHTSTSQTRKLRLQKSKLNNTYNLSTFIDKSVGINYFNIQKDIELEIRRKSQLRQQKKPIFEFKRFGENKF